jgi:hypothetical protein
MEREVVFETTRYTSSVNNRLFEVQKRTPWNNFLFNPPRHLKEHCSILSFPGFARMSVWYEYYWLSMEKVWNDIDGENRGNRRKACPRATLSSAIFKGAGQGLNKGLRSERPVTNHLSLKV